MKQTMKEAYVAPSIEVIEMENEGSVMMASGGVGGGYGNGGTFKSVSNSYNSRTRNSYSASSSDLEDMINDILTIEN